MNNVLTTLTSVSLTYEWGHRFLPQAADAKKEVGGLKSTPFQQPLEMESFFYDAGVLTC